MTIAILIAAGMFVFIVGILLWLAYCEVRDEARESMFGIGDGL